VIWIPGGLLTAPALFLAGAAASVHCAVMCGALSVHHARSAPELSAREALLWTHGGRVAGYAAMGSIAGAAGQAVLRHLPAVELGRGVQMMAALALVAVGIWLLLRRPRSSPACCRIPGAQATAHWPVRMRLLARGLLWALLPCGLLYAVLLLSAMSASAVSGAMLTAAFALGGSPLLALIGWSGRHRPAAELANRAAGLWLIGLGAIGVIAPIVFGSGGVIAWCAPGTG
jgi:hypothetical protein